MFLDFLDAMHNKVSLNSQVLFFTKQDRYNTFILAGTKRGAVYVDGFPHGGVIEQSHDGSQKVVFYNRGSVTNANTGWQDV